MLPNEIQPDLFATGELDGQWTNTSTAQSWSGTGTTGTDGTVTFTLKNAPSGCYATTVTNVSATGLTWDGATPTNSFCK